MPAGQRTRPRKRAQAKSPSARAAKFSRAPAECIGCSPWLPRGSSMSRESVSRADESGRASPPPSRNSSPARNTVEPVFVANRDGRGVQTSVPGSGSSLDFRGSPPAVDRYVNCSICLDRAAQQPSAGAIRLYGTATAAQNVFAIGPGPVHPHAEYAVIYIKKA